MVEVIYIWGNVTMVVDNEGEVLQHTRYYPYGEAIDVFDASVLANTATTADRAQPYLYGGKELERMHGLGEYELPRFFALTRTANRTAFHLADARQKRPTFAKKLDELANARSGARRLQSHLPLWTTQDPYLEKYYATGPYAHCASDPLNHFDPDGMETKLYFTKLPGAPKIPNKNTF